ncbi:unnamed protein product, partial [Amoebophrya sp. A120]
DDNFPGHEGFTVTRASRSASYRNDEDDGNFSSTTSNYGDSTDVSWDDEDEEYNVNDPEHNGQLDQDSSSAAGLSSVNSSRQGSRELVLRNFNGAVDGTEIELSTHGTTSTTKAEPRRSKRHMKRMMSPESHLLLPDEGRNKQKVGEGTLSGAGSSTLLRRETSATSSASRFSTVEHDSVTQMNCQPLPVSRRGGLILYSAKEQMAVNLLPTFFGRGELISHLSSAGKLSVERFLPWEFYDQSSATGVGGAGAAGKEHDDPTNASKTTGERYFQAAQGQLLRGLGAVGDDGQKQHASFRTSSSESSSS